MIVWPTNLIPANALATTNVAASDAATAQTNAEVYASNAATAAQSNADLYASNAAAAAQSNAEAASDPLGAAFTAGTNAIATAATNAAAGDAVVKASSLQDTNNFSDVAAPLVALKNVGTPYSSHVPMSTNFTIFAADHGKVFEVTTGTNTITATFDSSAQTAGFVCDVRKADSSTGAVSVNGSLLGTGGWLEQVMYNGVALINRAMFGSIGSDGSLTVTAPANASINLNTSGTGAVKSNGVAVTVQGNTFNPDGSLQPASMGLPAGSVVAVLGESVWGGTGGSYPELYMSVLNPNVAFYSYAVPSSVAGPVGTTNSGQAILAASTPAYQKFLNGVQTSGTGAVSSLVPGSGNLYVITTYGSNDSSSLAALPTFEGYMSSIWTTLHGYGANVKVVNVINWVGRGDTGAFNTATLNAFHNWLRSQSAYLQGGAGAAIPDYISDVESLTSTITNGANTGDPWSADGKHPTVIGSRYIAAIVTRDILSQVQIPKGLGNQPANFNFRDLSGGGLQGIVDVSSGTGPGANGGNFLAPGSLTGTGPGGQFLAGGFGNFPGGTLNMNASTTAGCTGIDMHAGAGTGVPGWERLYSTAAGNGGNLDFSSSSSGSAGFCLGNSQGTGIGGGFNFSAVNINGAFLTGNNSQNLWRTSEASPHNINIPNGKTDGFVTSNASQSITANVLTTPSAPTVTPMGATGSANYSYTLTAQTADGTATTVASSAGSTTTANATQTSVNFNRVIFPTMPTGTQQVTVYRTVGGATQGKIGQVQYPNTTQFDDTGQSGSGSSPTVNTTGILTIGNHETSSGSAPTIAAGAGAGTSPTVSISGNDSYGTITITTGTTPSASATVATITFNIPYVATPTVDDFVPKGVNAAALAAGALYPGSESTTNFTISAGTTALAASTTYTFSYHVN